MNLQIESMPVNHRPEPIMPDGRMYELMGEKGVRKMVSDHYDLLVKSSIKHLFPPEGEGLEQAKERSADFFIQKLGGPDYFNQNRGKPKLSQRHSYFKVTPQGRVTWLDCYRVVLTGLKLPDHVIVRFWGYLHDFSNWMVNSPDNGENTFEICNDA